MNPAHSDANPLIHLFKQDRSYGKLIRELCRRTNWSEGLIILHVRDQIPVYISPTGGMKRDLHEQTNEIIGPGWELVRGVWTNPEGIVYEPDIPAVGEKYPGLLDIPTFSASGDPWMSYFARRIHLIGKELSGQLEGAALVLNAFGKAIDLKKTDKEWLQLVTESRKSASLVAVTMRDLYNRETQKDRQ